MEDVGIDRTIAQMIGEKVDGETLSVTCVLCRVIGERGLQNLKTHFEREVCSKKSYSGKDAFDLIMYQSICAFAAYILRRLTRSLV
jgi:hypothetical protein